MSFERLIFEKGTKTGCPVDSFCVPTRSDWVSETTSFKAWRINDCGNPNSGVTCGTEYSRALIMQVYSPRECVAEEFCSLFVRMSTFATLQYSATYLYPSLLISLEGMGPI